MNWEERERILRGMEKSFPNEEHMEAFRAEANDVLENPGDDHLTPEQLQFFFDNPPPNNAK